MRAILKRCPCASALRTSGANLLGNGILTVLGDWSYKTHTTLSPTWQPTPMNRSRFTSSASTVASTSRFGDSVGFTPFAARMSSLHRATTWGGCAVRLRLHAQSCRLARDSTQKRLQGPQG